MLINMIQIIVFYFESQIRISEAKAAGFKMPITKDHWLYQYMDDRDGDGMVGE